MSEPKTDWKVDASAGGQVFRTALGLAALTQKSVWFSNIRQKRENPGLQAQHLAALQATAKLCNAKVAGDTLNSSSVVFSPRSIMADSQITVQVGTAGSVALVLQAAMFPSLLAKNRLRVIGGTHVPLAPSPEFLDAALFPVVRKMGGRLGVRLNSPGFFPKGNGTVHFASESSKLPLKKIKLIERGSLDGIECFSRSAGLPEEIAVRQAAFAKKALSELGAGFESHVSALESEETIGSSVVLLARFSKGAVLSAMALGKKGVPAETVANNAVVSLRREIKSGAPVDRFLGDQLIPFMALAKGTSVIRVSCLTEHTKTNLDLCKQLLDANFIVAGKIGEPAEITVDGINFKPEKQLKN